MSNPPDFMIFATIDAFSISNHENPEWTVAFTDGKSITGQLRHLGGTAYVLTSSTDHYFSSSQVVRLHPRKSGKAE